MTPENRALLLRIAARIEPGGTRPCANPNCACFNEGNAMRAALWDQATEHARLIRAEITPDDDWGRIS